MKMKALQIRYMQGILPLLEQDLIERTIPRKNRQSPSEIQALPKKRGS